MLKPEYGIIWDVDGTLVDTAQQHYDAWVRMSNEMGRSFDREDFRATFGRRNPEIVRYLFGEDLTDDQVHAYGEQKETYYRAAARDQTKLLPGVERLLREFAAFGCKQAIGSSAPRKNLEMIIEVTKTESWFLAIVGQEDTQRGKPFPEVFLRGAEKLGLPPERCLVFEDAVAGVEAAKAAGMACIGITAVGHHPAEKLMAAGANLVLPTLEEFAFLQALQLIDSAK